MKASSRIIAVNALWLTATEALARVMSFFLIMVVARKLGPGEMGIYAFGLAFTGIFEIFVNFGLEPYIQREISRRPDMAGPLFARVTCLKVVVYLLCLLLIVLTACLLIGSGLKRWVVLILSLTLFFKASQSTTNAFFRAFQKTQYEAAVQLSLRFVYSSAGIAALLSGHGLIVLVGMELIAQVTACFIAWGLFIKKIASPFHPIAWSGLWTLAVSVKDFLFLRIANILFESFDQVMLSAMAGNVATGLYSSCYRLISAFDFFPSALAGAFLPALSRLGIGDNRRFIEIFRSYYKYALIIGSGIAALLGGLADDLLPFIFGTAFSAGASTLVILSACLLLTFVNWSFSSAVIALNKEKQMLVIFVIGTAANIGLNLFLIPRFQQVGAAWATLASQVLLLSLQLRAVGEPFLSGLGLIGLSVRPVIAGLITFWMALFISDLNGSVIWKLFLSGMGFLLLLKLTGTLSYRELVEVKNVFRPARPSSKDAT